MTHPAALISTRLSALFSAWLFCLAVPGAVAAQPMPLDPPAGPGAMAPRLTQFAGGALCSWVEPDEEARDGAPALRLRYARFSDGAWEAARTAYGAPNLLANWADTPGIVTVSDEWMIAHALVTRPEGRHAYDVQLIVTLSGGMRWSPIWRLHSDNTAAEHGFVSCVPLPPGETGEATACWAFWLDGRAMAGDHDHGADAHNHAAHAHDQAGHGDMMLRAALISREAVTGDMPLDPRVCECCPTGAAMTERGPIVVYRDRAADETRDVYIVRRERGAWTQPAPVHADGWVIAGCPVSGPAVAAKGHNVCVAWYTGAGATERVLAAFSGDGGATFTPPLTIDDSLPMGRVDVALLDDGSAMVCWLDTRETRGAVMLRRLRPGGPPGEPLEVAPTGLDRDAGFPRIARAGDSLIVAWVDPTVEPSRLRAAVVPIGPP
jgi:hypothetical protein